MTAETSSYRSTDDSDVGSGFEFLAPRELDADQRELYDAIVGGRRSATRFPPVRDDGALRMPFNMLLYAPRLGDVVQSLGAAVRFDGGLDAYTREACICLVAVTRRCRHQWDVHRALAQDVGVEGYLLDGLLRGELGAPWPHATGAALQLAACLLREREGNDATLAEAAAGVDKSAAVEIAILVGYYDLLAGLHRLAGDDPLETVAAT